MLAGQWPPPADGTIERLKARLVAQGFEKREGRDFNITDALVASLDSIRMMLSLVAID